MAKLKDLGWLEPDENENTLVGMVTSNKLPESMAELVSKGKSDKGESHESEI